MKRNLIIPSLLLAFALLACSISINPTNPPAQPAVTVVTVVAPPPAVVTLTPSPTGPGPVLPPPVGPADVLRNGTYYAPAYGRTVTLVNGAYSVNTPTDIYNVNMLDAFALGDLNFDGVSDAAIILAENGGGTGFFESVIALYSSAGSYVQVGSAQLGDRVQVNSASINNGAINLDMVVQGPSDPMCCPSQTQIQSYRMFGTQLWMTGLTPKSGGTLRSINVTSPAIWASVSSPFTVSGDVAVSPFENTLVYRIYIPDGTKVNESSLMVSSAGMGTPGTFSQTFDLSMAGITGPVMVQFLELSAMDGSVVAMGSALVNVH